MKRRESKVALLSAMKSENVAARKAASSVLAARADPDFTIALREAAENDPNEEVRQICRLLLGD
jgi:HEAT repeat protein